MHVLSIVGDKVPLGGSEKITTPRNGPMVADEYAGERVIDQAILLCSIISRESFAIKKSSSTAQTCRSPITRMQCESRVTERKASGDARH